MQRALCYATTNWIVSNCICYSQLYLQHTWLHQKTACRHASRSATSFQSTIRLSPAAHVLRVGCTNPKQCTSMLLIAYWGGGGGQGVGYGQEVLLPAAYVLKMGCTSPKHSTGAATLEMNMLRKVATSMLARSTQCGCRPTRLRMAVAMDLAMKCLLSAPAMANPPSRSMITCMSIE